MINTESSKCRGHHSCNRKVIEDNLCLLHLPTRSAKAIDSNKFDEILLQEIKETKSDKNGIYVLDWEKLNFPEGHSLFESVKFDEVGEILANAWINLKSSNIQNIFIGTQEIRDLILTDSMVHKNTLIPVMKMRTLNVRGVNFLGDFHCASELRQLDASGAVFENKFSLVISPSENLSFCGSQFKGACTFSGASRLRFEPEANMSIRKLFFNNSVFEKPNQTLFNSVDLSTTSFDSVSMTGIRFNNPNFYQHTLNRNGLWNEALMLQKYKRNESNRSRTKVPGIRNSYENLMYECRQLRMAMEYIKDFDKSHDFYVGEMEAKLQCNPSVTLMAYKFSSRFGTNYKRALGVLTVFVLVHILLTALLSGDMSTKDTICGSKIVESLDNIGSVILHTLNTVTLQKTVLLKDSSSWQNLTDLIFKLIIPIQAAMFALALRNKTKR